MSILHNIFRHIANALRTPAPSLRGRAGGETVVLLVLFIFLSLSSFAQTRVISGTVSDDMGPIMMANVVEKDPNNRIVSASQTDMMGNFSMEVKNTKNKLEITYVGCKKYSVTIGNNTTFVV